LVDNRATEEVIQPVEASSVKNTSHSESEPKTASLNDNNRSGQPSEYGETSIHYEEMRKSNHGASWGERG
jgi:hypothetical protein